MYTFEFTTPVLFGLVLDLRVLEAVRIGYATAIDIEGQRLVFVHAHLLGVLGEHISVIRSLKPDVVICCHPHRAKRLYPDLPILGDWMVKTHIFCSGLDQVLHIEEDPDA